MAAGDQAAEAVETLGFEHSEPPYEAQLSHCGILQPGGELRLDSGWGSPKAHEPYIVTPFRAVAYIESSFGYISFED